MTPEQVLQLSQKNLEFVKRVSGKIPAVPSNIQATEEGIELGDYLISPIEEILSSNMIRPMITKIKWVLTVFIYHSGSFNPYDGGTPPDVEDKELGTFDNVAAALVEIASMDIENHIASIAEQMEYEEMEEQSRKYYEEHMTNQESLCPHGKEYHECNACLTASDLAYDAARENRRFGR